MKKPKSKLPWKEGIGETQVDIQDNEENWLLTRYDNHFEEEDISYIIRACNNFPKAIELLRLYYKGASCKEKLYLSEVDEFLKEIENV